MDDPLRIAQAAVEHATRCGASQADATVTVAQRFSTEARERTVTKLEQSTSRSLTVRAYVEGAKATLSTADLTEDSIAAFVREAVAAAGHVERDPYGGVPEPQPPTDGSDLEIYADDVVQRAGSDKVADARALEEAIRAEDPRIENSSGSRVGDAVTTVALANSSGFAGTYRTSTVFRMSGPIARDGDDKRSASYGTAARSYGAVESVASVARNAARRAVQMCGARKPSTMRVPVIFERDVAAAVLGDVFTPLSAANVAVGNSFFIDRVGQRIGSDLVTFIDDGRLPGGLGSAPFDADSTPTRRTVVCERGILQTFLYDTYYARKLGADSTGNATAGGVGPTNFYLAPGTRSLADIIASTRRGVIIFDTIGFSTESVSGVYSRGARGLMIEGGEPAYPIEEFTVSAKLPDMLSAIDAVADDLRFDAGIVSPSFRVAEMTISGN